MVTLRQVAEAAGVNTPTASKALRDGGDLNQETVRRIRETAARLGYHPRQRRGGVVSARRTVGIICPELMGGYYARIATRLSDTLRSRGLEVLLAVSDFRPEQEETLLLSFADYRLSGVICITEQDVGEAVTAFKKICDIPVVVLAANYPAENHDIICIDEREGIRSLVRHLYDLGHRYLAFVGDRYSDNRLEYLRQALRELDDSIPEPYVALSDLRHAACGYEGCAKVLSMAPRPTAIVAEYDDVALGAYRRLSEAGLSIPRDISLAGFDNADYCPYLPVGLTSVDSHGDALCQVTVETLLRKMDDPTYRVVQRIFLRPSLVVRESTGNCFET